MNLSATLILAFGMSMDAFAASIGKGASLHQPRFREAIRTGLIFGVVEAITPLIGWAIGLFASQYIMEWDHWGGLNIAGGMIVVVGYAMVINMMRAGYLMPFFYLGFVTAAFTNFNLVALGVIGVVMAVLYIQLSPKYNKSQVVQAGPANANDLDNELD